MDHLTPLQSNLFKSLLDLLVAVAWAWWDRLRASHDECRAMAVERKRPLLRPETRRSMRLPPRRFHRTPTGVVAVLVSEPGMEDRLRRALGGRANLRFTSTWAELQQVVALVAPSAIVADPAADVRGDPERHLAWLSWQCRIPVILYTTLTPQRAELLLRLAVQRIRHVIFHRLDDAPRRFLDAIDWDRSGPPLQAA